MGYIQNGDCLLFECEKPENIEKLETDVLFKGQQHEHKLRGKFCLGKVGDKVYLHSKNCELYHTEHDTLHIPEGFYRLEKVREYDHFLEESREVID